MKHDYHCHSHSSNCIRNLPCCHSDGRALRNAGALTGELTVGMFVHVHQLAFDNDTAPDSSIFQQTPIPENMHGTTDNFLNCFMCMIEEDLDRVFMQRAGRCCGHYCQLLGVCLSILARGRH